LARDNSKWEAETCSVFFFSDRIDLKVKQRSFETGLFGEALKTECVM